MVGMVANLDNYDEDELRELERYIEIRREELDPNTPPSTKEISCLVHDLLLDCDPSEYAAGAGEHIVIKGIMEMKDCSIVKIETQTGHKFRIEVHNID